MRIELSTWPAVERYFDQGNDLVMMAIGSTEEHGRHNPLGTDTLVAMLLAEDAAKETGVVVAPPLWFGWSPHHMVLPGTITIRPEILTELLYDVIQSLQTHGFRKFIVINGHRIVNISWMQLSAERAQRQLGVKVVLFDPAYMSKELVAKIGFGPVGHSEEIETSQILYKRPDLVHMEKAVDNPVVPHELYSVDPCFAGDTLCYVPSTAADQKKAVELAGGTTGSPSKSCPEKGKVYHEYLVANLVKVIRQLQN